MICRLTTLLLGFAALFVLSGPAQAQTTVWSATLTPKSFSNSVGCDNAQTQNRKCSNSNRLSEDDFTDDGTSYRVRKIVDKNNGDLEFQLTAQATTATQTLTLMIDGVSYALADAAHTTPSNRSTWKWSNANLSWSADTDVAVSLVAIDAPATGQPRVFGAPQVGKTLTALIDDIEDGNGVPTSASDFTYQWLRDGTDIPGATEDTYAVTTTDVGHRIRVRVSFTDLRGNAEGPLTSDAHPQSGRTVEVGPTGTCLADNDWCATMTVEDQARDGGFLIYELDFIDENTSESYFKYGSLTNNPFEHNGTLYEVYTIYRNGVLANPEVYVGITRVPRGTVYQFGEHTFTADDISHDGGGDRWPIPFDLFWYDGQEIAVSLKFGNFRAKGTVWISGTAKEGQTLTARVRDVSDLNGLTSPVYTYQWVRVDGSDKTDIAGATSSTYRLVAADVGKKVEVRISFTDDEGNSEALTTDESDLIENAPVFRGTHGTRHLAETVGAATVQTAENIGTPVTATDPGNEPLTYSLQGTDADKFTFVSSSGQIRTKVGERYDYETDPSYEVTIRADNANGDWATIDVTINITNNTNEQPLAPTAVTVEVPIGNTMSLDVSWTAPDNTGRPPITHYNLRYREDSVQTWTNGPQGVTGTTAQITGLTRNTLYWVQVQAVNDDGESAWSTSSSDSNSDSNSNSNSNSNSDSDSDSDSDSNSDSNSDFGRTSAPSVRFGASAYTAIEGFQNATVTVELNPADDTAVTIPLTVTNQDGASSSDYSGIPASVTFAAGETRKTFTITATNDSSDDEGESVLLGFGTLPVGINEGSPATAKVTLLQDSGISTWYVSFGQSSYTATEGGAGARVTINLSSPWKPERNEALTVPLFTPEPQGGATRADFSGVPESVTFQPGQTQVTFTVRATDDSNDDDGESVLLQFRNLFPDDLKVGRGSFTATVHLADNDGTQRVTVSFGAATYTATEGGAGATVSVFLDRTPDEAVTIPLTITNNGASSADYSGVPESVTFSTNDSERTFTVTATDDNIDDDLESVTFGFDNYSLPEEVLLGSPSEATVNLIDNDGGQERLTVRFDGSSNSAVRKLREGAITICIST